jgi:hypothetical protein
VGPIDPAAVVFEYPQRQTYLWRPGVVRPTLAGLAGHTPVIEVTAGALPAGLRLDPSTGVISGTPTSVGSPMVTLRSGAPGPLARGRRNPTGRALAPKGHPMDDLLQLTLFVAGWILLQRVILPKLGVPG